MAFMKKNNIYSDYMNKMFKQRGKSADQGMATTDDILNSKKNMLVSSIQNNVQKNIIEESSQEIEETAEIMSFMKEAGGTVYQPIADEMFRILADGGSPVPQSKIFEFIKKLPKIGKEEETGEEQSNINSQGTRAFVGYQPDTFSELSNDMSSMFNEGAPMNPYSQKNIITMEEEQMDNSKPLTEISDSPVNTSKKNDPKMNSRTILTSQLAGMYGLAGANMFSALLERMPRDKFNRQQMLADGMMGSQERGDASRGNYNPNTGMFRPDDQLPVQFKGNNSGRIGMGYYEGGGETDEDEDPSRRELREQAKKELINYMRPRDFAGNPNVTDKSVVGFRKNLSGDTLANPNEKAGRALFKNKYGDVNFFAQKYNEFRNDLESKPQTAIIGNNTDETQSPTVTSIDPDDWTDPTEMTMRESAKKARNLNRINRQENLGFQKIQRDAFVRQGNMAMFEEGGNVEIGEEMELSEEEIQYLLDQGYELDIIE